MLITRRWAQVFIAKQKSTNSLIDKRRLRIFLRVKQRGSLKLNLKSDPNQGHMIQEIAFSKSTKEEN